MTQAEVTELLFAIQSFYPNWNNKLDKDTIVKMYSRIYKPFPLDQCLAALDDYVRTDTTGFAPVPGQLIGRINKVNTPKLLNSEEAWNLVFKALGNSIYHADEEFDKLPKLVKKTIGSSIYLRELASLPTAQIQSVEKSQFIKVYVKECEDEIQNLNIDSKLIERMKNKAKDVIENKTSETV